MFKCDIHTKGVFLAGFITWCITFGGSWITYSNTITELKVNQKLLLEERTLMVGTINVLADKVAKNAEHSAVTTSVLNRLNGTLTKIGDSLDIIVNETTKNSIRLDNFEKNK